MDKSLDAVIQFIISNQEPSGSFTTYESYPVVNPAAGWTKLPDPSPFITANILFSLLQLNDVRFNDAIERGAKSLLVAKEGKGFWRFWPVKSKQHPLPLDIDDTGIVSFVLERCGYELDNKNILANNQNAQGYFETWLRPRLSNFFSSPLSTYGFIKDYKLALPTQKLGYFAYDDKEPAIAANTLLYLGENSSTKACIKLIIDEIKSGVIPKKFYDDDVVAYYHIARAYANGVPGFKEIAQIVADRIWARFDKEISGENEMLCAMAANILLDFKLETELAEKLLNKIAVGTSYPENWVTRPYFCSNDRNFLAGSPVLNAALFLEACSKLKRLN